MPAQELTLDGLLSLTPVEAGKDAVADAARRLFLSHVKSQDCVHDTFFPTHTRDPNESRIAADWFHWEKFAILYVSQAICKNKDPYNIHTMLNPEKTDEVLAETYSSPQWKKIGFALYTMLFPELVGDQQTGVTFKHYMNDDRREWANRLVEKVKDSQWIYSVIHPIVKGQCTDAEYNRDMNILFVKLHLLDPTAVMPAFTHLRKALPDLNLELVTTNYLGDPLDWKLIKPDLDEMLRKATYPRNSSRLSISQVEVYHGVQVTEFIMQDARDIGLWSGKYANNKRISGVTDRCVVM